MVEGNGIMWKPLECSILSWNVRFENDASYLKINKCSECSFFGEITNYSAKGKGRQGETEQSCLFSLGGSNSIHYRTLQNIYIYRDNTYHYTYTVIHYIPSWSVIQMFVSLPNIIRTNAEQMEQYKSCLPNNVRELPNTSLCPFPHRPAPLRWELVSTQ